MPPSDPAVAPEADEAAAVEAALRRVEAAVRQRHAQRATRAGDREAVQSMLLELQEAAGLQEAPAVSPRRWLGPVLVWTRKVVYHLFGKWLLRPLMQQQSRFNQATLRMLEESWTAQQRLAEEVDRLRHRLDGTAAAGDDGGIPEA